MKYDLKKPCDNCPFLREGGIRLHPGRVQEIAGGMLDFQGITFPCHKTVKGEETEGGRFYNPPPTAKHCAGALIFAEKNETATQMMRISGRLGEYDPGKLDADSFDKVFDDIDEFLECAYEEEKRNDDKRRRSEHRSPVRPEELTYGKE